MGRYGRVKVGKQRLSKERGREEHVRMVSKRGVAEDEKQGNRPMLSLPPPHWPSPPRQTPVPRITTGF